MAAGWDEVLAAAKGQTVWWHAWGGDPKINEFIAWVGALALERHGVTLNHVKLASTADAVAAVLAEQEAGKTDGGSVDLIWINGENFAAMKAKGLLFGPFAESLPHWPLVDVAGKPAVATDFTLPTEGYESPWAMAQLVFEYDTARLTDPPRDLAALAAFAAANPGRFTYPQPPDYMGVTFLKQAMYGLLADPSVMQAPVGESYAELTAPLWAFLDALHPNLWRAARLSPRMNRPWGSFWRMARWISRSPSTRAGPAPRLLPETCPTACAPSPLTVAPSEMPRFWRFPSTHPSRKARKSLPILSFRRKCRRARKTRRCWASRPC